MSTPLYSNITQHKAVLVTAVSATTITSLTGILQAEADPLFCRLSSPPRVYQTGPELNLTLLLLRPGAATVATHVTVCLLLTKLSDESGRAAGDSELTVFLLISQ